MDLSTNDGRLAFIGPYATKYGLDPAIVCAVCEQESAWNPWAARFEPAFEARYVRPAVPTAPSTEELTKAMSFGLMQVMGEVARELGFGGVSLLQLCDPNIGVDIGCRKLKKCFAEYTEPEVALLRYNGGGNPNYGKQVLSRVASYQLHPAAQAVT
jgi:soluble lytic murein transglycosylase-like protein